MAKCYNKYCNERYVPDDGYACCRWEKCPNFDGIKTTAQDEPKCDMVDHPAHYQGEYECIDIMRETFGDEAVRWFCVCNAYKYRFRSGRKQGEPAQSDIAKAEWYETYMMEHLMQNNTLAWERRRKEEVVRNAYCECEAK